MKLTRKEKEMFVLYHDIEMEKQNGEIGSLDIAYFFTYRISKWDETVLNGTFTELKEKEPELFKEFFEYING